MRSSSVARPLALECPIGGEELSEDSFDQRNQLELASMRARVERAVLVEVGRKSAVDPQAQLPFRRLRLLRT
jgi:hypothetical protein